MPAALSAPQRAASAYPAVPQRHKDSPSPTKKRRVETGSDSRPAPRPEPSRPHSSPHKPRSSHLPPPHSTAHRPRPRASTVVQDGDADPNDPELQSRLHSSTLKLRDAWDDILRRHSLPAPSPPVPSRAPASSPTRRHRPAGRTRAIPVDEDDIIDLGSMEIIQDRGVLRRSRAGAFALGGYTDAIDDVLVGPDTGVGEPEQGGSGGEERGAAGEGSFEEEEDEDDEWDEPNALDSEAYAGSSDDELGDMDELPSLPSLLFREQRRRDADRRDQLRDFWEHEARARGGSEAGGGAAHEAGAGAVGNRTLEAVEVADDDDELDFFAPAPSVAPSPVPRPRRSSSSPLQVEVATPSRKVKTQSHAPSTTAALRTAVGAVQLASSSPTRPLGTSSSVKPRQPSSTAAARLELPEQASSSSAVSAARADQDETRQEKTSEKKRKKRKKRKGRLDEATCGDAEALTQQGLSTTSADLGPARSAVAPASEQKQGLQTPPNSFTTHKRSMPYARSVPARPPVSSSPLREVIAVASPSPTASPSPRPSAQGPAEPSRSPSLEIIYPRPRARSPSLAVWTAPARPVSPELGIPAPSSSARRPPPAHQQQTYQHPTPTPTPPPVPVAPTSRARRGLATAAAGKTPTPPKKAKGPRHSFELVIDRKPSRMSMTPRPSAPRAAAAQPASSERGATRLPRTAVKPVGEDVEMRSPGGLSTPPLSKRSTRAAQPPASAPERLSVAPVAEVKAAKSRRKSKPGQAGSHAAAALRAAAKAVKAKVEAEPDAAGLDDDPLLLESSPSPVKKRASTTGPRPQLRRAVTATPAPVKRTGSASRRVRERRMTTVAPSSSRREEASDDDGFGAW
ncbi:hypothetical protein JCM3775_002005 [Rhodotorula graminis]